MKYLSLLRPVICAACLVLFVACADVKNEEIKLKVICYGGNFTGLYTVDSGDSVSFGGSTTSNSIYEYEKEVEVEEQLEVEAVPVDTSDDSSVTSLKIKIYRDGSLIKTTEDSDVTVTSISLIYTAGETADSE